MRVALALLVGMLAGAFDAMAQVSPGPLASAHAAYDGATQCFQCHASGSGSMDARCLTCHTEIAALRKARRGLHARTGTATCARCHPDHGGRTFDLIEFEGGSPEKFDHAKAGFALSGKHAELECSSCHTPKLQRDPLLAGKRRVRDTAHSWIGLERDCKSCHTDVHRGQIGTDCQRCHDEKAWKPAPGFDHTKARYPLTGEHAKVECMTCHASERVSRERDAKGQRLAQWKPLPFAQCSSCHTDPHKGRFGADCMRCHSTDGFDRIDSKRFDHDRTRYPLRGSHAAVACDACHRGAKGAIDKPAFARCDDCHRDAHAGTATLAGQAVDCASCHDVRTFEHSILPLAAHQQSDFPLRGAHLTAACDGCHRTLPASAVASVGPARVEMRPAHGRCVDCHQDPHGGRFAPKGPRGRAEDCESCHTDAHFSPSEFGPEAHAHARFVLEGAHRAVPCAQCHTEMAALAPRSTREAKAVRSLPFEDVRRACADCHKDPHAGQFAAKRGGACDRCHGSDAFAPATGFDHDRDAAFKLEGAHARTPCAACHIPTKNAAGSTHVVYRPLSSRCESCHTVSPSGSGAERKGDRRRAPALSSTSSPEEAAHASHPS